MAAPVVAVAVAIWAMWAWKMKGNDNFAPGVCERLQPFLLQEIVGQELALRQFSDAACDFLRREESSPTGSTKPLIISVHGPPGVGKSLTHLLAARALYNKHPLSEMQCPGSSCAGYKVVYGMDYVAEHRASQHSLLRASLLSHLGGVRRALLVIEEYDKADCDTRAMLRQLLNNLQIANITGAAPIVLMESNTGYTQMHKLLQNAGDRSRVDAEEAQRLLKDLVFQKWADDGCEQRSDTIKMVSMIDFFLPYLPLEKVHIRQLFERRLSEEAAELRRDFSVDLEWGAPELDFLVSKVDFEDGYAIEGAKEVSTVATRHLTRLLRPWQVEQRDRRESPTVASAGASALSEALRNLRKYRQEVLGLPSVERSAEIPDVQTVLKLQLDAIGNRLRLRSK